MYQWLVLNRLSSLFQPRKVSLSLSSLRSSSYGTEPLPRDRRPKGPYGSTHVSPTTGPGVNTKDPQHDPTSRLSRTPSTVLRVLLGLGPWDKYVKTYDSDTERPG